MRKIDPREIDLIKASVLGKTREWVLAHPEVAIDKRHIKKYNKLVKLRGQGVPLAYLFGHKEFFGLEFLVNKNVLIPRPDTELMVELVLKKLGTKNLELGTTLIDVGTGSGCIPISIIKTFNPTLPSPTRGGKGRGFAVYAIDISKSALAVATKNAKRHGIKIKFLLGNLLEPFIKTYNLKPITHNLVITANLPYLTPEQVKSELSIQHEPKLALVAGNDGLKYYRELLKQIKSLLYKHYNFTNFITFIEIDPSQTTSIKLLIKKIIPSANIIIHKDLSGKNRVVEIVFPPL
jgi:release factor glutamine methyltransferase